MAHSQLLDEHNKACTAILREQIKKAALQKEIAQFVEKSNLKVEWSKYKWLTRLDLRGVVDDNNFAHLRILSMLDLVRKIVVKIPSPKSKKNTSHLPPKSVPIDLTNTHSVSVQKRGRRERGSRHSSSCSSSSESSQSSICSSDDREYRSRRRYRRERRHRYSASSRSDRKRKRRRRHRHRHKHRRENAHSKKHSRKISLVL